MSNMTAFTAAAPLRLHAAPTTPRSPRRRTSPTLCAPPPPKPAATPARGAAVAAGQASPFGPELAALVARQAAAPLYATHAAHLPPAAAAAQAASPPAYLDDDAAGDGAGGVAAARLRDAREALVAGARTGVYGEFPGIEKEGGALWPQMRADACWRDCMSFLRVVHYGCAAEGQPWVSSEGAAVMFEAYGMLEVPLDPMVFAVGELAKGADELFEEGEEEARGIARAAFKDLSDLLVAMKDGKLDDWARSPRAVV